MSAKPGGLPTRLPTEATLTLFDARAVSAEAVALGRVMNRHEIARFLRIRERNRFPKQWTWVRLGQAAAMLSVKPADLRRWMTTDATLLPGRNESFEIPVAEFMAFADLMEDRREREDAESYARWIARYVEHVRRRDGDEEAEAFLLRIREREAEE